MALRRIGLTVSILCAVVVTGVATADETVPSICPLILHQERVDGEERELAVDLAESRLTAAAAIFTLVEELLENDAVERMVYLTVKHDHDVAEIELKRQRLLLKRKEAEIDQYASVCSPAGSDETEVDRRAAFDDARRRYLQADCHRIGKELAIAEVDLAYRNEVLASVRDLRKHAVATRQDVIRAELDVDMARKRVEGQRRRVQECVDSGVAGGGR